ncbi:MAG: nucleoside triphosphate pyrophosphohydrolase [Rhodospirillales bacterium]|nr:nucleoside triphosphate pyrophosphohydrolase [Rhodospirillales bacterium]
MSELPNTQRLIEIMIQLRDPEKGCAWDKEQTFETIAPHTIEEAYEVADAIEKADMAGLRDELGDLLLHVVYHTQMADEEELFDFEDVAKTICEKMVRRHPHVFGDVEMGTPHQLNQAWEAQKAAERDQKASVDGDRKASALDGVTAGLPSLTRAAKLQRRAARVGFDWPDARQVIDKIREETDEIEQEMASEASSDRLEEEIGDLLFACVNFARKKEIDPETALRRANAKFERRFRKIEDLLATEGNTPESATLDEMEAMWIRAKAAE